MRTIHRYLVGLRGGQHVQMPVGAELLHVENSHQAPGQLLDLWAVIDRESPDEKRLIRAFSVGAALPDEPGRHIGSVLLTSGTGRAVWHVFDGGPAPGPGPDPDL